MKTESSDTIAVDDSRQALHPKIIAIVPDDGHHFVLHACMVLDAS
jgi:hypothetical protein